CASWATGAGADEYDGRYETTLLLYFNHLYLHCRQCSSQSPISSRSQQPQQQPATMDPANPVRFNIGCQSDSDDLEGELPEQRAGADEESDGYYNDAESEAARDAMSRSSSLQRILASISFWSQLLVQHFLEDGGGGGEIKDGDEFKDDLVFYVRRRLPDRGEAAAASSSSSIGTTVEVHRKHKHNYRLILADQLIDLEESVYLNLIMQQFAYTVTCAVCTRTGARELQILRRFTSRVFASPSRHCMDGKACREEITYPNIFFSVHNYDELFADCVVRDSELLCVELVACDRRGRLQGVLFLGSIRYESVLEVYQARAGGGTRGGSSSSAPAGGQAPSGWLFRSVSAASSASVGRRRVEFLRMRGPHGKGHAEVAVTAAPAPVGEDGASQRESRRERRLSGGVGGVGGFRGGGMKKSRSDSANIDSTGGGGGGEVPPHEVEARDIEEEFGDEDGDGEAAEPAADDGGAAGGGSGGVWQIGKSFGQAWHWFKERRRAGSVSLSACLTYVSLPWHRIVADLLDTRQQPVLAFDLPAG
uniref:Minichromosome maintenance protein 2 n=1 Tax=Macrostomum lignano TaxID=282301 RepID=A0A1I8F3B7_9PLAT